jgi:hypothetical protein
MYMIGAFKMASFPTGWGFCTFLALGLLADRATVVRS